MANLEDSFLADLEDLSDNDNENLDEDNGDAEHMEEDVNGDLADIEALNYDDLDSVSKLQKTQRYTDIMKKVEDALEKGSDVSNCNGCYVMQLMMSDSFSNSLTI